MFLRDDVTVLLKDITGQIQPLPTDDRERLIQGGRHYSEMLPLEYVPSDEYVAAYENALGLFAPETARAVAAVTDEIVGLGECVLVSLARAGTPLGVLVRRYARYRYGADLPHYTISIIRGRGIDRNAVRDIISAHPDKRLIFFDGWTGKGAIANTLAAELGELGISAPLAVLSDPAAVADIRGTFGDFLIPSSLLNSTVCGLMSRTVLNSDLIFDGDYHGVVYHTEFSESDRTYDFISRVEQHFATVAPYSGGASKADIRSAAKSDVQKISDTFSVSDINFIKPSIGESTRVLLRRKPDVILVSEDTDSAPYLAHLLRLAEEKGVPVEPFPLHAYRACGIIKKLEDA